MELLQLRYFLEVARSQHITQSARELCISQPSLTQALHRLERELGVKLFEPSGRGIRLTEAGDFYRQRIELVIENLDGATEELKRFEDGRKATIRINVTSASSIVIDAVAAWRAKHPETHFQIESNETAEGEASSFDIEVRMAFSKAARKNAHARLFEEHIMLAVPSDETAIGASETEQGGPKTETAREAVSIETAKGEGFIMLAGSRNISDLCLSRCAKLGFRPNVTFESDNPSVVRKMIGLGLGVGFWPEHSWGELGGGAQLLPIREAGFARTIQVSRIEHGNAHPEAEAFYDFLLAQFESRWTE